LLKFRIKVGKSFNYSVLVQTGFESYLGSLVLNLAVHTYKYNKIVVNPGV